MLEFLESKYVAIPEEEEKDLGIDFEGLVEQTHLLRKERMEDETDYQFLMEEIKKSLKGYTPEQQKSFFEKMLSEVKERILRECGNLGNLSAFEQAFNLIEEAPVSEIGAAAAYTTDGKILVETGTRYFEEDPYTLLLALAEIGRSKYMTDVHHEYIHSLHIDKNYLRAENIREWINRILPYVAIGGALQYPKTFPLAVGAYYLNYVLDKKAYKQYTILHETQAFRGSDRFTHDFLGIIEHLNTLKRYKAVKNNKDIDMAIVADVEVRSLYALGLDDKQIGELIKTAKWDSKGLRFISLDDKIRELMLERGLEQEDVDNLVMADDLKNKINFYKTSVIASEVVKEHADALALITK